MTGVQPKRRPSACLPCHQRKVRCDAAVSGTPCSRCMSKARELDCVLVPPRSLRKGPSRVQARRPSSLYLQSGGSELAQAPLVNRSQGIFTNTPPQFESSNTPLHGTPGTQHSNESTVVSEENVQVQTLHRMTDQRSSPQDAPRTPAETHNFEVVEYFDNLNSVCILGEALGRRQTRRLVQVDLSAPQGITTQQRELANLDPQDAAYVCSRGIFMTPPRSACTSLVKLWFKHVYPYTPVLNRETFYRDLMKGECSHFILYAILANVIPYASEDLVLAAGYPNRNAAQKDFSSKAQLIHDFGCERRQMVLLQGSCILSSFQVSYAPTKDFRFWLHNAFRIATQMGLHRENLADDLDPSTHRLCRKIWWMIYARDVLFNLSGFANSRCIDDREVDMSILNNDDWPEEGLSAEAESLLGATTSIHRSYFTHNCQLAILGSKFLRFSRSKSPISQLEAHQFSDEFSAWRRMLPEDFSTNRVSTWTNDNVWILFLLALSYRLECLFYRRVREDHRESGGSGEIAWFKKQLAACTFELDTLMSRAIEHDVVKFAPASLIVCACNLLAFHLENALDEESTPSRKFSAKARINSLLSYFAEAGENWQMAKWTLRVSEWVVKRANLRIDLENPQATSPSNTDKENPIIGQEERNERLANLEWPVPLAPFFANESLLTFSDTIPDPWLHDLFDDGHYQSDVNLLSLGLE